MAPLVWIAVRFSKLRNSARLSPPEADPQPKGYRAMSNQEICDWTATEMAQRIRDREVSCLEVMQAHLQQIEQVNPTVNAIITL